MKKLLAVLLAVVMMFTCIFVTVSASEGVTILSIIETILTIQELGNYASDLSEAISEASSAEFIARRAQWREYWNRIIIYTGVDEEYFREFWELSYATGGNPAYFDNVPLTDYQIAAYQSFVLIEDTILDGLTLDDICTYCFRDDGVAIDNPDTDLDDEGNVTITGSAFSEMAQMYNDHYGPKTTKEYISWRTDARYAEVTENYVAPRLSFFTEGYFCGETQWNEVYLVPWYTDGTTDYFSQYQFHFYYETTKDDSGVRTMTLYCDVWDMLNGGDVQTLTITNKLLDIRYIDFSLPTYESRLLFCPYSSYTSYIQRPYSTWTFDHALTDNIGHKMMYSPDLSTSINIGVYLGCWQSAVSAHDEGTCEFGCGHDTGYYCSDKQIYMNFDFIDTTKLTEDDVVTLSGDTFYDYVITNSTTGDSTTVYNYITNNYNYPVSEDSGSSGEEDSGSASGDVNVSGNIDVGGSVDVNVNVNNNGSADGGSMPVDVNLENYLEQTPEQAKPITDFFAIFFDFLPAELLGLICLGVVVAIILRVWGR